MPRRAVSVPHTLPRRDAGSLGGGVPPPSPSCFADTLSALKRDLEACERRTKELQELISSLAAYAIGDRNSKSPPGAFTIPARRRRGPVPMTDEERRVKAATKARRWRARQKPESVPGSKKNYSSGGDAADEAVAKPPEPAPAEDEPLREIAEIVQAITKARAEATQFVGHDRRAHRGKLDAIARLRRRGGFLIKGLKRGTELPISKDEAKAWRTAAQGSDELFEETLAHLSPPIQQLSDWHTDPVDGTLTRVSTAVAAADAPV